VEPVSAASGAAPSTKGGGERPVFIKFRRHPAAIDSAKDPPFRASKDLGRAAMGETSASLLKRAKDAFEREVRTRRTGSSRVSFRAIARRHGPEFSAPTCSIAGGGSMTAIAAYRPFVGAGPGAAGHVSNLGVICFKRSGTRRRRRRSKRLLELQPNDRKALAQPRLLPGAGSVFWRKPGLFTRSGDEESAAKVRERLLPPEPAEARRSETAAPRQRARRGATQGEGGGAVRATAAALGSAPKAALERDFGQWLEEVSLSRPGEGPELVRAGGGELVAQISEKVYVTPFLLRAPRRGDVRPAVPRGGEGGVGIRRPAGVLARAEGNGELVLTGRGRSPAALQPRAGRVWVKLCRARALRQSIGIAVRVQRLPEGALSSPASLSGAGPMLPRRARATPVVLPVPSDLPTLGAPRSRVALGRSTWGTRWRTVPELKDSSSGRTKSAALPLEGRRLPVLQGAC